MKTYKISGNYLFQRSILNTVLIAALFLAVTLSPLAYSHGQGTEKSAEAVATTAEQKNRAKELTLQLGTLIAEYKSAKATESSDLANQLTTLAEERRKILGELIENDPAEALRQALPDDVLDQMPAKAQAFLEQHRAMEGELQLLHVDYKDPSQSHYVYLLSTDTGEHYSLHFAKHGLDIQSGSRVKVNGLALYGIKARDAGETEGAVALDDGTTGLEILAAGGSGATTTGTTTGMALSNNLGEQRTLVILVNFQDAPVEPYTVTYAKSLVFGTTSNFFLENSFQQTWLSGDVIGWFTIALSSTICDPYTLASQAKSAATAAGTNLSNYAHIVYAFPKNGCGGTGLGSVGGSPSEAWIIGSLDLGVVGHELGHNFGLYHSHSLECGAAVLGTSCTIMEYGDSFDTMGNLNPGHYNAYQKEQLGWLNAGVSPDIVTVLSDGTYMLDNYESISSGPKALKILKSTDPTTGAKTWYYLESRQAIGFDGFLSGNTNVLNGVLLHTGIEGDTNSSYLLDMTPGSGSLNVYDWRDPGLAIGESYADSDAGVTITTASVTATGAAVTVTFGGSGTKVTNPLTVSVSADQSSYTRSQTVSINSMVSSGGVPVANATVSFTITKSNGAVVTATATSGTNGAAVYKLRLRKQDPVGTYKATTVATSNAMSSSAATTAFTVQ